jgi:hypothetical protein
MPLPAAVPIIAAGVSALGGLLGARSASRSQREANALNRRALDFAEGQYRDRGIYRDAAAGMMGQFGLPPELWSQGAYNPELEFQRYQALGGSNPMRGRALADVMESPDRMALVKQRIADMDAAGEQGLERRFRRVGQRAATLGRVGAAGVTTELGTLQADYERDRQAQINELLRETTEADLNDRFRRLGAVASEDDAQYGRRVDDFARRDTLGRSSLEDRIRRWNAGRGAQGEDLARMISLATLGYGGDPTNVLTGLAQNAQGRADAAGASAAGAWGSAGNFLADLYRYRAPGTPASSGTYLPQPGVA